MRVGAQRQVFEYSFPWCFDNSVYLSEKLLRRSLQEAGFVRDIDLETRFPKNVTHADARGSHDYATDDAKQPPHSMKCVALLALVDGPATDAAADLRLGYQR